MLTWNDRERCATLDHFFEIMVNVDETNRSVQLKSALSLDRQAREPCRLAGLV